MRSTTKKDIENSTFSEDPDENARRQSLNLKFLMVSAKKFNKFNLQLKLMKKVSSEQLKQTSFSANHEPLK